MNGKRSVSMFVGVAGAALAMSAITSAALAQTNQTTQRPHRSYNMMHSPQHNAQQSSQAQKQETVTLEIRGADSPEGARLLSSALTAHQVDASLQAAQGRPCRVTAEIDPQTDLGAIGKAVMTTNTPDRAQTPPSLDLVVFGRFDKASVKKASDALAKLKGVDAKASNANTSAGEYNIRIDGGAKITANQIRHTLQSAGVWTQFTRNGSARRT